MHKVVLYVEDEKSLHETVRRFLGLDSRFAAVEYVACATYAEAITAYVGLVGRPTPTRVVLVTDNDLDPGHTGFDVIAELARRGLTGPVVMVSGALPDGEPVAAALPVTVMAKPVRMSRLCDAVAALLVEPPETT